MNSRSAQHARRGGTLVIVAVSLTFIMGMAALSIDFARIYTAQTELKASADAAALAGTGVLLNEDRLKGPIALNTVLTAARAATADYALRNKVMGQGPDVDQNDANLPTGDVVMGYLRDPTNRDAPLDLSDPNRFNAVQVLVRRDEQRNGSIAMTFAQLFGHQSTGLVVRTSGDPLGFAAAARNAAGSIDPDVPAYELRTLEQLVSDNVSGVESSARLMLALLVAQGCNFLLLDEPINHLDIPARTQFEAALTNFEGTALAVVHDRYFIQGFASVVGILEFRVDLKCFL